ncbi:MAG TPA: hypothetical protein VIG57_17390 [Candidatus Entotheonella sp.]
MKCPKCGYVSHDYLDACRSSKCGIDLVDFKAQMQLHVIRAGHIDLVTVLGGAEGFGATGAGNEPFFDSQMLMESEENGDFDISLDDDLSLTMSITVDESAEISGIFNRPGFSFEMDDAPASSISDRRASGVPLGPPTSGYATVMLDLGDMAHPHDPPGEEVEMPEPDIIPSHTDAAIMPSESGEIDLSSEYFSPSSEVAKTPLASESIDNLDLPETDRPAMPLFTTAEEDISASTEAAFAAFLPLQSEELVLPSLQSQEEAFDNDPDITMVDDANALTLADEVFDLSPPPTPESMPVNTPGVTQDQVLQDDDLALPVPPTTGEQEITSLQTVPADDITSQTLTDDAFLLPEPPAQEVTLVDTQEATQEQIPQGDAFRLPPLPMPDLTASHPQDATVADEENSQTLLDGMFNRPADLTQE